MSDRQASPAEAVANSAVDLVDVAKARREWAEAYAARHRKRRRRGTAIAVALSCLSGASAYLSMSLVATPFFDRILFAVCIFTAPLAMAAMAVSTNLRGKGAFRNWLAVWFAALGGGVLGLATYLMAGSILAAFLHLVMSIAVAAMLSSCLYIPPDEELETSVVLPQILDTENWSSSTSSKTELSHYREAEEMAAAWLRRFGYSDAVVTRDGHDNGIDVTSRGAIAQVKLWSKKRVGIKEVQRLAGALATGQVAFFFSHKGYTRPALEWALSPERRTALFTLKGDGNLRAVNLLAVRSLQRAPFRVYRRPEPTSLKYRLSLGAFAAVGIVGGPIVAGQVLTTPGVKVLPSLLVMCLMWVPFFGLFFSALGRDVQRLARAVRHWKRTKEWDGWRAIVEERISAAPEPSAPPDTFIGSYEKSSIDVFFFIVGVLLSARRLKEWALRRLRIRGRPRVPFGFADLMAAVFMMDTGSLDDDWPGSRSRRRPRSVARGVQQETAGDAKPTRTGAGTSRT